MFFTMLRLSTRHPLRAHASPLTQVDDSGSTARWRNGNALSMISRNEDLRDLAPTRSYRRHRVSAAFFLRQQLSIDHPARGRRFDLSRPPIEQALTLAIPYDAHFTPLNIIGALEGTTPLAIESSKL